MAAHVSAVRALYKRILVLHRFLPVDLRALGDQYVKDEFRRHRGASPAEGARFMTEWQGEEERREHCALEGSCAADHHIGHALLQPRILGSVRENYKDTLQTQILESAQDRLGPARFGANLPEEKLRDFQDEQVGQLYELMLESTKPNRQFDIREDGQ